LTVEGLVDAYYMYNIGATTSITSPAGGPIAVVRSFDLNSNQFTLNYAKIGLGVNPDPVGLRIDLGYGATGAIVNGATPMSINSIVAGDAFLIEQAYATLTPVTNLTIDFGKFVTTAGAEVIESNKNWTYSRSILFFNIPLLHTGARFTYKVSDLLTLQASVVNTWNGNGFGAATGPNKTYGVSANVTLPQGTNIIGTGYFGKVDPSTDTRVLADLVIAQTVGALGLNLNFDYVNDKAGLIDNFYGVAVMAHYGVNDHLALTGRFEYVHNGDPAHVTLLEGTLTAAVPLGGRFEFRAEFRDDHAGQPNFNNGTDKNQVTGTGAFLAWF
jgi:hypothetical protein